MVISPVLIIIFVSILVATSFFYIINRPKKPIFTCIFLILLLSSVFFTFIINIDLSSTSNIVNSKDSFVRFITSFVTMSSTPSKQLLLESFNAFSFIDIALILVTIIVSVLEMRLLFKNKPKGENSKWIYMKI